MGAIGQADDQVGISAAPDADNLDPLAAEGVMGMGNGDKSRRGLGRRGS
jgi:hypothetical protein